MRDTAHEGAAYRTLAAQRAYGAARDGPYGAPAAGRSALPRVSAMAGPDLLSAYSVLWLRPGAPLRVVQAAYRALAAQYHPDTGGDVVTMARINWAYETLRTALGSSDDH